MENIFGKLGLNLAPKATLERTNGRVVLGVVHFCGVCTLPQRFTSAEMFPLCTYINHLCPLYLEYLFLKAALGLCDYVGT
jgi:hypothetical protein